MSNQRSTSLRDRFRPQAVSPRPAALRSVAAAAGPRPCDHEDVARYSDVRLAICIGRQCCSAVLGELYRRHGGAAHHVASRVCGPDQAEEVVAGALLELWLRPLPFDPDRQSLRSFVLAQAHVRAAQVVRTARRADAASSATAAATSRGVAGESPVVHSGEEHATGLLSCLPEPEGRVVALAYLDGYSCAELAPLLDQPAAAVARRMRAALVSLAAHSTQMEPQC